jgi:hypothetical protein
MCGCGQKTKIAPVTSRKYGWVKGQPFKWIIGHQNRMAPTDYIVNPGTDCWEWQRAKANGGYGRMTVAGRVVRAHRAYWEAINGPVPEGLWVLHKCDNPCCVNPDHLYVGDAADNTRDAVERGRFKPNTMRGEANPRHKLTASQAQAIRSEYIPRVVTASALALRYGVSKKLVLNIVHGKAWAECAR